LKAPPVPTKENPARGIAGRISAYRSKADNPKSKPFTCKEVFDLTLGQPATMI